MKLCFSYLFRNLLYSNSYGDLFVKKYNNRFKNSHSLLTTYTTSKNNLKDLEHKSIKLFYDTNDLDEETLIRQIYDVHVDIFTELETLVDNTTVEVTPVEVTPVEVTPVEGTSSEVQSAV